MNGTMHSDNMPAAVAPAVQRKCKRCGQALWVSPILCCGVNLRPPDNFICERCAPAAAEEAEANTPAGRIERAWQRLCPAIFRVHMPTVIERLPDRAAHRKAMAWKYGSQGLILVGPTGAGKSRSAYLLLRRLLDEGRKIRAFAPHLGEFANECARRFGTDCADADEWMRQLGKADVVFFDDIGKSARTERAQAQFFSLIDARICNGKPIIATMNKGAMDDQFSTDRLGPLKRRLFEFSDVVEFSTR